MELYVSRDIVIPYEALLCRDGKREMHSNDINCFYKSIYQYFMYIYMCIPFC